MLLFAEYFLLNLYLLFRLMIYNDERQRRSCMTCQSIISEINNGNVLNTKS